MSGSAPLVSDDVQLDRSSALGLAMSLSYLAIRLNAAGRSEEALNATREATKVYRHLARMNPDVFTPGLPKSLGVLAVELGETRWQYAVLAAAQEAIVYTARWSTTIPPGTYPN